MPDVLVRGLRGRAGPGRAPPQPVGSAGIGIVGGSGRVPGVRAVLHRGAQRLPGTGGGPLHGQPRRPGGAGRLHRRDLGHALLGRAGVARSRVGVPGVDPAVGAGRRGGGRRRAGRAHGHAHADLLRHGRHVDRRLPGAPGPARSDLQPRDRRPCLPDAVGGGAHRRRRGRVGGLGRPRRRPAGGAALRGGRPRTGLLRPRRHRSDRHRRQRGAGTAGAERQAGGHAGPASGPGHGCLRAAGVAAVAGSRRGRSGGGGRGGVAHDPRGAGRVGGAGAPTPATRC